MQDQHVTWLVSLQLKDPSGPPFWKQLTWGPPLSPRTFSNSLAGNPESPKWGTSRELQGLARPARTRSARVKNSTNVIKKVQLSYARGCQQFTWGQTQWICVLKKVDTEKRFYSKFPTMVCQSFFCPVISLANSLWFFLLIFWLRGNWIGSEICAKQEHENSEWVSAECKDFSPLYCLLSLQAVFQNKAALKFLSALKILVRMFFFQSLLDWGTKIITKWSEYNECSSGTHKKTIWFECWRRFEKREGLWVESVCL